MKNFRNGYSVFLSTIGIGGMIEDVTNLIYLFSAVIGLILLVWSVIDRIKDYKNAQTKEDKEKAKESLKDGVKDVIEAGKDIYEDYKDDGKINGSNKKI